MLSGSPVLIGAVTVLVTLVAVFLSYNANEGLPFVPTYSLTAEVPNSAGLVRGNEVRIGGARVGVVSDIGAKPQDDGSVVALLTLKLDPRVKPLPKDSTLLIRPRSALGLKYVEITEGTEQDGYAENATIPETASATRPVEIDDFFNMWDDPTRIGSRGNLAGYGAAFAGRGESLNRFLADLEPLTRDLEPVLRNLSDPATGFDRLFPALGRAAAEVAPVATTQGALFAALDTTFGAWASVAEPLQESISGGPPALETATRELAAQRPFLAESEELFRRFRPGFASLSAAAPNLAVAFRVGTPALKRSPALNRRLTRTLEIVEDLGDDPRVPAGLDRVTRTATLLEPLVAFLKPAQTTCNYLTLFFANAASTISEADTIGTRIRVNPMALPLFAGSEAGPTSVPANGPALPPNAPTREKSLAYDSFLHSNPLPNTAAPSQERECEAGNEDYPTFNLVNKQEIGNLAGNQGTFTQWTRRGEP
jgi:ABC-type transporter Mla subunit MlaD